MQWKVHSEKSLYTDQWLDVQTADVELPNGRHLDHRFIRMGPSAGAVVLDEAQENVLLLWRHRFITDAWGYEIPIGAVDSGESPAEAAAREVEEETGWKPANLRPMVVTHPSGGILDSTHHLYRAVGATHTGPPMDSFESTRIEWVPVDDLRRLIDKHQIVAGSTLVAILYVIATR